jgi:hypothetical protein
MRKILAMLVLFLCATIAYGLTSVVICPDHGVKAHPVPSHRHQQVLEFIERKLK